ncbi:hypothetical protein HDU82_000056 [Entophlyctis luteolus]|nr:hypothetical protein HDU82_000056 [Entophlyctis luteolus]
MLDDVPAAANPAVALTPPLGLPALDKERLLPIANVARLMKRALPENAKIAKEAKVSAALAYTELFRESSSPLKVSCSTSFRLHIENKAAERCAMEKRKTVSGEDILAALESLGFDNYNRCLKVYLQKYRENTKADRLPLREEEERVVMRRQGTLSAHSFNANALQAYELQQQEQQQHDVFTG